jgi:hypothetical protein
VAQNPAGTDNGAIKSFLTLQNPPPTADAGPDQSVFMGHTVTLDATGSTDPYGTITSYEWTQIAGTDVTLSDPNSQTPTFTAPDVAMTGEVLQFQLTVTDNRALSQTDTVSIAVKWGFLDDFSTDTTGTYGKFFIDGSSSTFTYDSSGKRGKVLTGANEGIIVQSGIFPPSQRTNTGVFSLDFTPTGSYSGSRYIAIRLNDTGDTYYEFYASPLSGSISKVRLGVVVDTVAFTDYEDSPFTTYNIKFTFSSESLTIEAFGGTVTLATTNTSSITMSYFEVWTSEMNAYYDNFQLEAVP